MGPGPCARRPVGRAELSPAWRWWSSESLPVAGGGEGAEAGGGTSRLQLRGTPHRPPHRPAGPGAGELLCSLWGPARGGRGAQELPAGFSLLGELEEDDDEEDEKLTPVRPGGLVAVFCPVRLFRHTGQLSCCVGTEGGAVQRPSAGRGRPGPRPAGSPAATRVRCSRRGRGDCRAAAARAPPARSRPCTRGTPAQSLQDGESVTAWDPLGQAGTKSPRCTGRGGGSVGKGKAARRLIATHLRVPR